MTLPCSTCQHYRASDVSGREHGGCMRPGLALDGKTITPPLRGFSVQFQRSPEGLAGLQHLPEAWTPC